MAHKHEYENDSPRIKGGVMRGILVIAVVLAITVLAHTSWRYYNNDGFGYYCLFSFSCSVPEMVGRSSYVISRQNFSSSESGYLVTVLGIQEQDSAKIINASEPDTYGRLSVIHGSDDGEKAVIENFVQIAKNSSNEMVNFAQIGNIRDRKEGVANLTTVRNFTNSSREARDGIITITKNQQDDWAEDLYQQLLFAKKEIENTTNAVNDKYLHGPIYHNVSTFIRSYELMEKIFRVYIYSDGEKPYFHEGPMQSIYASEGWFIKQMEENKQFVTTDYKKAHAFYLPYSVYEMRVGIPGPEHHNMQNMSLFIRDYINMIAKKYPFWNRTHGSDHFFVACHDWGPYTTREHLELKTNAIKVICNSDESEGYFVKGQDTSLPETYLRNMKQPPPDLGGLPPKKRPFFAFFAGANHGRVRPILFKYWKGTDPDMKVYENLPKSISRKRSYAKHMKMSKYCICPMGYEVNSPRMVEAIYYDCVPVIISNNFYLPFSEVINWDSFSVKVAEEDIPNLKKILQGIPRHKYLEMQSNLSRVRKHFLWHKKPERYDIFHMILHSVWNSRLKRIV